MQFNLDPKQLNKIKKFVPADKLQKIESIISLLGGGNPQSLQFKCRHCQHQGSAQSFQQDNTIACPKCQQKDLDVVSQGGENIPIAIKEETQNIYLNSQPQAPTDKIVTSNQRFKIAVILIIIVAIAWLIYNFAR